MNTPSFPYLLSDTIPFSPTWFPAQGGFSLRDTNKAPLMHLHAKDLASHSTLKLRHAQPATMDEMKSTLDEKELKAKLSITNQSTIQLNESTVAILNQDRDDSSDSSDDSDDSDSDDEKDDTTDLIKELEKIKKERKEALEKTRLVQEQIVQDEIEQQAAQGNPLMMGEKNDASVKRKWDDDVVFKNQGGLITQPKQKRFINDLIRSDFHRKFMGKYLK